MIIPNKICPHCGENKWDVERRFRNGKLHIYYKCSKKAAEWAKIRYDREDSKKKISRKLYDKTEKGKKSILMSSYKIKKRKRDNLEDSYIIQNLKTIFWKLGKKFNKNSITKEQIEAYKQSILTQRQLKQLKHGKSNNS